jgi:tRNA(Ile)-lysidine synthase
MLHLAARAVPHLDLRLHVVHVDHAMRTNSAATALDVAGAASALGVPWTIVWSPVDRRSRTSPEAAAREVRYAVLERAAVRLGCDFVATAHTLDDQAETVLLRAVRGGRPAGIAACRGRLVRPLLHVRRAKLRAWLSGEGIAWTEDPTNADVSLERNWLRAEVMPLLEARRPGAVKALARAAELARDDADVLDAMAAQAFASASRRSGALFVPDDALGGPRPVDARVVLEALRASGAPMSRATVDTVLSLTVGGVAVCGHGVTAWRVRDGIAFVTAAADSPPPVRLSMGTIESAEWGIRVRVSDAAPPDAWTWRCTLDRAGELWLRTRRPGDRVPTVTGTRKVQDVMVDAKLPRFTRDAVPVLEADGRPVAVVGITRPPSTGPIVVDVDPLTDTWWSVKGNRGSSPSRAQEWLGR